MWQHPVKMLKSEVLANECFYESPDQTSFRIYHAFDKNPLRKKLDFAHQKYDQLSRKSEQQQDSYLDLMDTKNLAETCTRIKSIATESYSRCKHFSFGDFSSEESKLPMILEKIGREIETMEIFRLNKNVLDGLSKYCPNVTGLKLVDATNIFNSFSFIKYKPFFQNITSLEIRKSSGFYSSLSRIKRFQSFDKLLIALSEVNALETLKIEYIEISPDTVDILKKFNSLKCLHLIRYQETATLLPFLPTFEYLNQLLLSTEDTESNQIVAEIVYNNID